MPPEGVWENIFDNDKDLSISERLVPNRSSNLSIACPGSATSRLAVVNKASHLCGPCVQLVEG